MKIVKNIQEIAKAAMFVGLASFSLIASCLAYHVLENYLRFAL